MRSDCLVLLLGMGTVKAVEEDVAHENVIQDLEEVQVVSDLFVAFWIVVVRLFVGNFLKHLVEEHVNTAVALDELFELLQNRVELFGVLFDMVNDTIDPVLVDSVIARKPIAHSVLMQLSQRSTKRNVIGHLPMDLVLLRNILLAFAVYHVVKWCVIELGSVVRGLKRTN